MTPRLLGLIDILAREVEQQIDQARADERYAIVRYLHRQGGRAADLAEDVDLGLHHEEEK